MRWNAVRSAGRPLGWLGVLVLALLVRDGVVYSVWDGASSSSVSVVASQPRFCRNHSYLPMIAR